MVFFKFAVQHGDEGCGGDVILARLNHRQHLAHDDQRAGAGRAQVCVESEGDSRAPCAVSETASEMQPSGVSYGRLGRPSRRHSKAD